LVKKSFLFLMTSCLASREFVQTCKDLRCVFDASWFMDKQALRAHRVKLGGAKRFDMDKIADLESALPHMLPESAANFNESMESLGLSSTSDRVLFYDHSGGQFVASARAWWMLRVFSHRSDRLHVFSEQMSEKSSERECDDAFAWLDGGRWPVSARNEVRENDPVYSGRFDESLVWSREQVLANVEAAKSERRAVIVDARSEQRFLGLVDEPRAGVARGAIPGSVNLPFTELFDERQRLLGVDKLRQLFEQRGIDIDDESKQIVASCGTGVTACVLALAFYEAGRRDVAVYDGSWTEYGSDNRLPRINTGSSD
jgi:thiosulfate/3-mercaptopyruvate sulfurtransferase